MYNVSYVDAGSRASFYIIDDKRGFKEFDDKESAVYASNTQFTLSKYNLAPNVLSEVGRIRLPKNLRYDDDKLSRWGFITELAEVISCSGNECECGDCEDIYDSMMPQIDKLCSKISDIGYSFGDCHIGNIGYVKRKGRKVLVCIDTGEESVQSEDYDEYADGCSCYQCRQFKGSY